MAAYLPRIVDIELDELLAGLPAISIEGPRAVGKTETALQRAATVYCLDNAAQAETLQAEPDRIVKGNAPILIDEWQRMPYSWDMVRRAVDQNPVASQFLLTGSAAPAESPTHSGAGRIVTVRMRPLSLAERNLGESTVALKELLAGRRPPLQGETDIGLVDYVAEIVRSGFPAIRMLSDRLRRVQLDSYLDRILEHDLSNLGHNIRDRATLRRWMTAFAAATSTTASYATIQDAATPGEPDKPARATTAIYRRMLEQLWMIEEVPAWLPTGNRFRRLASSPVHQLADPALAARLLGVDIDALINGADVGPPIPRDGTLLGALFESLVTMSVRTYAQHNEAQVSHLRTRGGEQEVDLIVEKADGSVVALEVKLSALVNDSDVRHLHWLARHIGPRLLDAAVISTGPQAYRRHDGIGVIPAALLSP